MGRFRRALAEPRVTTARMSYYSFRQTLCIQYSSIFCFQQGRNGRAISIPFKQFLIFLEISLVAARRHAREQWRRYRLFVNAVAATALAATATAATALAATALAATALAATALAATALASTAIAAVVLASFNSHDLRGT